MESQADERHEYIDGAIYAMAGASNGHNAICANFLGTLHAKLRGKKCRPFGSDTKVRIRLPDQVRFYYPDVLVTCQPNASHESFQDNPTVIVEVLSPSTRRIDEGEKQEAYLSISSLDTLLFVDSSRRAVAVFQRGDNGFTASECLDASQLISLPSLGIELSLDEIYEAAELDSE
jgi:Uma2 family endonuclease